MFKIMHNSLCMENKSVDGGEGHFFRMISLQGLQTYLWMPTTALLYPVIL